jgi:hypothetical protein
MGHERKTGAQTDKPLPRAPGRRPARAPDAASRKGFDRQRLVPQDEPPADVLDDGNIAGEKDFELGPSSED